MRPTVRKEETMPDFMYGVCVGAEGARSGGERSEPERRAPSRPLFGVLGSGHRNVMFIQVFTFQK